MFKKRNKKIEESTLKPNEALEIDAFSKYQNNYTPEADTGYRGLLVAYQTKAVVRLLVQNANETTEEVVGTISHYDENYSQLVVIVGNSMKRLTFDQIIDVVIPDGVGE